jgi:hypothetical protein
MSPGRTRDEVLAVFADGKLEPTVLLPKNMNLPKVSFFWDRDCLLNGIFPKRFGWVWERLSPYMESMIHAMLEEDHKEAVEKNHQVFQGQISILNTVDEISKSQLHYASYSLAHKEGTLGKVSNNPAKQNHSSIVHWVGEKLYKEPGYEIKEILGCQQQLEDKQNEEKASNHFAI